MITKNTVEVFENEIYMNDGFTYDPKWGFMDSSENSKEHFKRYLVGVQPIGIYSTDISDRSLKDSINVADRESLYIGAWIDRETNLRHWDYVKGFDDLKEAKKVGHKLEQIAIFDSIEMKEIRLENE